MKVLVIYCHPSNNSFTYEVKNEFIRGLHDGNHEYTLLDLYALDFKFLYAQIIVFFIAFSLIFIHPLSFIYAHCKCYYK